MSTHTTPTLERLWIHPKILLRLTTPLNGQLSLHAAFNPLATLRVIQSRLDPLLDKLVHLLRCPSDEALRVKERVEVPFDRVKVRISLDPLDKIILETKLLDLVGGLMRQYL